MSSALTNTGARFAAGAVRFCGDPSTTPVRYARPSSISTTVLATLFRFPYRLFRKASLTVVSFVQIQRPRQPSRTGSTLIGLTSPIPPAKISSKEHAVVIGPGGLGRSTRRPCQSRSALASCTDHCGRDGHVFAGHFGTRIGKTAESSLRRFFSSVSARFGGRGRAHAARVDYADRAGGGGGVS